jgi:hypothetical protein
MIILEYADTPAVIVAAPLTMTNRRSFKIIVTDDFGNINNELSKTTSSRRRSIHFGGNEIFLCKVSSYICHNV